MKIKHLLIGVLAMAAAVACKQDEPVVEPILEVNKTAVALTATAGESTFNVTANNSWTASADADWVSLDPASGDASEKAVTVKVTADDNTATEVREATVTVKSADLTRTIKVKQAAAAGTVDPEAPTYVLVGDAVGGWDVDKNGVILTLKDGYYTATEVAVAAKKGMHFTKNNKWEGNIKGLHGLIAPDEIGEVGNNDISLTEGGVYNVYLTEALDKFYFMTEGKTPADAVEHVDLATVWGVCGAIDGNQWGASPDVELTADGEWLSAKGIAFTQVNFKIRGNNSWADDVKWGTAESNQTCELNKAIAVSTCTEFKAANPEAGDNPNIYISVAAGSYDVYFSPEKKEVWVMTSGYKPGDEVPEEPVDPDQPAKSGWYIVGSFTGSGWGWDAAAGLQLDVLDENYYVYYGLELAEGAQWKFLQGTSWNIGAAEVGADRSSVDPNTIQAKGTANIAVSAAGKYDIYLSADATKYYVMSEGKTPAEATEPGVAVITYSVSGTIKDAAWSNTYAPALLVEEGGYLVAKNLEFVWASALYGEYGADQIELKIFETGTYNGYGLSEAMTYAVNAEIPVVYGGGSNIAVAVPEGTYDVYFDKENAKVWVMEVGYKPGEKEPETPETPALEITELYMLGGACDTGWSLDIMTPFKYEGSVWVWEGNLKPGNDNAFRFPLQKVSNQWWPCLVPNADATAVTLKTADCDNPYRVPSDGYYKVTVNPANSALTVERLGDRREAAVEVTELYVLGSACDTGWSLDDMTAFQNNGGVFTWTGNLKANEEFRFPLQRNWWPSLMISADGSTLLYGQNDDDKVVYKVSETAVYTITIDVRDWYNRSYKIEKQEPKPEYTLDGKQWYYSNQGVLVDLGLYEEGVMVVAIPLMDGSGFGAYMYGPYEVEKTDATSGKIIFTQYDPEWDEFMDPVEYPYSELSENLVMIGAEPLTGDPTPLPFVAVEEPYEIVFEEIGGADPVGPIENGQYWFFNGTKVMAPLAEGTTTGALPAGNVINGASTEKNIFTLMYDPDMSYYTIMDSYGRFLGQTDETGNITVTDVLPTGEDYAYYLWCVETGYGEAVSIYNAAYYYDITYSSANNNWALVDGGYEYPETLPTLVKAENPVEEPTGPQAITVAEFLALSVGTTEYELTGVIEGTYNTTYGNFYLNDGTGKVLVYGLTATPQTSNDKSFASLGLRDGDTLTLIGQRADYNGTAQVGGPAYYVSHIAAPYVDFAVGSATVDAEATTYSIEFESNVAWTATASAGVTVNPASGDGDGTVVMTFAANTSNDPIDHTVTFTATDLTKTFTLTQKGVPAEGAEPKYVKVTEEQTDWSGKYLIVFGNNAHATLSGKDLNATKAVNPVAGEIEATSDLDAAVMTVSKNGDKYVMTYPDGKYFSMAKNASSSSTTAFDLTFTYTANGVKIAGVASGTTYILYHNSTNGNYYRCYVDKNGQSGYNLPALYKYTE